MDRRDLRVIAHGVCVARYYILRIRPGWVATPSPDTPGHSALRSLSEATNCEQPRARTKLGVLFCDDSRRVSIKYCCSRLCFTMSNRRFPPPWSVEETAACFKRPSPCLRLLRRRAGGDDRRPNCFRATRRGGSRQTFAKLPELLRK